MQTSTLEINLNCSIFKAIVLYFSKAQEQQQNSYDLKHITTGRNVPLSGTKRRGQMKRVVSSHRTYGKRFEENVTQKRMTQDARKTLCFLFIREKAVWSSTQN